MKTATNEQNSSLNIGSIGTVMLQSIQKHFAIVVAHGEETTVRGKIESVDNLDFFIVKFGKVIVNSQCGHVNLE